MSDLAEPGATAARAGDATEAGGAASAPVRREATAGAPISRLIHPRPVRRTGHAAGRQVVTLSCYRFASWTDRARQFLSMGARPWMFRPLAGLGFAKMMGTGTGEGFDPAPDTAVWTILAAWEDAAAAHAGLRHPIFARRAARATEACTLTLKPVTASGRWGGMAPFEPATDASPEGEPIAVLTRGTIRPRAAMGFWRSVPAINRQIAADPGMSFRLGMGEVPLLHQVTFSVWRDLGAMRAFAYRGEGHRAAIRGVRAGDWFAEELYARFAVLSAGGRWRGRALSL
ncbi:MAG: spheroidene monooxygenase [Paracoccaceae bacterium]